MDPILIVIEFHMKYKTFRHLLPDICFQHPQNKVNRNTITNSSNVNGRTLKIVGRKFNPKSVT